MMQQSGPGDTGAPSAQPAPELPSPAVVPGSAPHPGQAAYEPRTGWPPLAAVLVAAAIFVAAVTSATLATFAVAHLTGEGPPGTQQGTLQNERILLISILIMQAVISVLTVVAAGRYGSRRAEMLALRAPRGGVRTVVLAFAGLILIATAVNTIARFTSPGDMERDLQPFIGLAHSDLWWICLLAVGIGAPVSEELLFRGFLFPALAKSPVGAAGAGIFTALSWAALHASYSITGVVEVGLIGLYLAFVLWRSGSLWVPILCHGLYNSALFALIALSPAVPVTGG